MSEGNVRLDVSIVVCTFDRPESLCRLLDSIGTQVTALSVEVIVIDNHPETKSCEPLKPLYSHLKVRWIEEPRRGLAVARNTGIAVARAMVIVFADDDMEVTPGWLQALAQPVVDSEFDVVLGPVLPLRLESPAEHLFEVYGAHGHTQSRAGYDHAWLRSHRWSLPLWQVGGIGNSAVHRGVLAEDRAGLFEEALGVGTPAGSSEDLYFLYRLLRTKGRALREPAAFVRHAHRETLQELSGQLCNYRRGEVCFCLLALLRHGDPRALTHLCVRIPAWRTRLILDELGRRARGQRLIPFSLMARELAGYVSGPAALMASLRRAARLKQLRSDRHIGPEVAR